MICLYCTDREGVEYYLWWCAGSSGKASDTSSDKWWIKSVLLQDVRFSFAEDVVCTAWQMLLKCWWFCTEIISFKICTTLIQKFVLQFHWAECGFENCNTEDFQLSAYNSMQYGRHAVQIVRLHKNDQRNSTNWKGWDPVGQHEPPPRLLFPHPDHESRSGSISPPNSNHLVLGQRGRKTAVQSSFCT